MSEQQKLKRLKIRTGIFFIVVFVIAIGCAHLIQRSQENREKLKASYMAESMIRRIESELCEGSKFLIELTFRIADQQTKDNALDQREHENAAVYDFSGKRILLVEDNELNAEIAMTILQGNGLAVDWVKDGTDCFAALEEKPAHYYDAVLMDIQMPKMNGYEATQKIRTSHGKNADIPIIAMTANAFEEDRKKAFEVGMNGHVAKPINVEMLMKTLRENLGQT